MVELVARLEEIDDDVEDCVDVLFVEVSMVVEEETEFVAVDEVLVDVYDDVIEVFELEVELVPEDFAVVVVEVFDDERVEVEVFDVEELLLSSKVVSIRRTKEEQ